MITAEQYDQAKELIQGYEMQRCKEAIQNLRCICCNKAMEPEENIFPVLDNLERGAWKEGTVALVNFGYGSRLHDGDTYCVGLCDQCMCKAVEQGIVIDYNAVCLKKK
jgi:hypothetical protein